MANYEMQFAVFLIAIAIGPHLQPVLSNPIEASREELGRKKVNLDSSFAEIMHDVFYEKQQAAMAAKDHPMMAILAEIGKLELTQHRYEQKALSEAKDIVERYFISDQPSSSHELPGDAKRLANLIVRRVIDNACELEMYAVETIRKKIHWLLRRYDFQSRVREVAVEYSVRIRDKEARAIKAKTLMEHALEKFQDESRDELTVEQSNNLLRTVDTIIEEAAITRSIDINEMLDANRQLLEDIKLTENITIGHVIPLRDTAVQVVNFSDVVNYDEMLANSHLAMVLDRIEQRLRQIDEQFSKNIQEVFYEREKRAFDKDNHALFALSALMAEIEIVMHSAELRMLLLLKNMLLDYFVTDRTKQLSDNLVENKNLIDLMVQRATGYAIEAAFMEVEDRRKRLFLLMQKYDHNSIKTIARRFYKGLNDRKLRLSKADADSFTSLKKYKYDVAFILDDDQVSETMRNIDELIDDVVVDSEQAIAEEYDVTPEGLGESFLLEQMVGSSLVDKIRQVKEETRPYIEPIDNESIESVDMQDVHLFEDSLVSPQLQHNTL